MLALWLADALVAAGLNVVEEPNWQLRGKPFTSIDGHMAHHTASPKSSTLATNLHVVINGNAVAPGPIANVLLWRDGTYHVIAAGRCNHAGKGVLPWVPQDQGNTRLLSTEAVNDGVGELWAPEMVEAYEIGTAAMLRHLGLSSARATTHAEYAPTRKIDPAGPTGGRIDTLPGRSTWSPVAWRERIADRLRPPPPVETPDPVPQPPVEDDMKIAILKPQGAYAVFLAETTQSGIALNVRWSGEGTAKVQSVIDAHVAAGAEVRTILITDLRNCFLLGPLPKGDPAYNWTLDDFAG